MFKRLLKKDRESKPMPPMPSWDKIVEMLYDKNLNSLCGEVISVIYSKDKSMRFVVLKNEKGYYTYNFEVLYQLDEDEWKYVYGDEDALPATWTGGYGSGLFFDEHLLMKELKSTPEYKQYFI